MAQYSFGTGLLYFVPSGANPTPIQIGVIQGISFKMSEKTVKLYGALKAPVDVAKAEMDISGKFKFGQINSKVVSAILTGSTTASGIKTLTEQTSSIPGTPYQVTVTNSATWTEDGGVIDNNTGLPMTRVASAPATTQYSVAAGVYTFAAADTTHSVTIRYAYTTSATGTTVSYSNQAMGAATLYAMRFGESYGSKTMLHELPAVVIAGFSLEMANNAHTISECDFEAMADSTGLVYKSYWAE